MVELSKTIVIKEEKKPVTQANVFRDLLSGNYESVFNDFLLRYQLAGQFESSTNFAEKLTEVDKNFTFLSKNEEALYKLKLANQFFFRDSLPPTLNETCFDLYK